MDRPIYSFSVYMPVVLAACAYGTLEKIAQMEPDHYSVLALVSSPRIITVENKNPQPMAVVEPPLSAKRVELLRLLDELRAATVASGMKLLSLDEINEELGRNRT